ncbi:MAG: UDP-4-amino-4,6-dideoxy-N-acetyl-beta-L-altrosamine N-acetyltransferase [Campylobacterales bacterium]|nr:UDP-4-amino-4,6-dideoxy-N-acetyl-beta-L-altrosamine N-acetyltransferase [Campylobacterales bacterium]
MSIQLLNFTKLDVTQKEMILSWRNHSDIRQWMLHPNTISMDEHMIFIESLKNRSDNRYFLVQRDDEYLGVIDFTAITEDSAEFGIYGNPNVHGVGKILMVTLIDYAFTTLHISKLIATVFSDNEKAKHLYTSFDFTQTNRNLYHNREIITMELCHDNR